MKAGLVLLSFILGVGGALGQAPVAPAAPAINPDQHGPSLTMTEKVAINSIVEKQKAVLEQQRAVTDALREIEMEITKNHPGYHLSENTGQLEKDVVKGVKK